jgi:hypothetical protein
VASETTHLRLVQGDESAQFLQELGAGAIPVTPEVFGDERRRPIGVALRGDFAAVPWFAGVFGRALARGLSAGSVGLTVFAGPTAGKAVPAAFDVSLYEDGRRRRLRLALDDLSALPGRLLLAALVRFEAVHLWPNPAVEGVDEDAMLPFRLAPSVLQACADARLLARPRSA